jgi:hypothetical protein
MTDTTFDPNANVTREQLVTLIYRYAEFKGFDIIVTADLSGYTDADAVGSWAVDAFQWAVAENIVKGTTTTTLSPATGATRAELATIIKGFAKTFMASGSWIDIWGNKNRLKTCRRRCRCGGNPLAMLRIASPREACRCGGQSARYARIASPRRSLPLRRAIRSLCSLNAKDNT